MDGSGFPLSFGIQGGNTNEQTTLCLLEQDIIRDFNLSKFVVCTDAGLSSASNRLFNNVAEMMNLCVNKARNGTWMLYVYKKFRDENSKSTTKVVKRLWHMRNCPNGVMIQL